MRYPEVKPNLSNSDSGNPYLYMVVATLFYSTIPLAIHLSGGATTPFAVSAGLTVGTVVGIHVFLRRITGINLRYVTVWKAYRSSTTISNDGSATIVLTTLFVFSRFELLFFAWSIMYVDTAVSSSLFETWALIVVLLLKYTERLQGIRRPTPLISYLLMAISIVPISMIIFATSPSEELSDVGLPVLGLSLAVLAPIVASCDAFGFYLSKRISNCLSGSDRCDDHNNHQDSDNNVHLFANLITNGAALVVAVPFLLILMIYESRSSLDDMLIPFMGGMLAGFTIRNLGSMFWRKATIWSNRKEIQSIQYASPILAILWLGITVGIEVRRIDLLILGTVTVVVINTLINFDPEVQGRSETEPSGSADKQEKRESTPDTNLKLRSGYRLKALVLSLLSFGSFVYFRDELFANHDFGWTSEIWWTVIAVGSTVFALLFYFAFSDRLDILLLGKRSSREFAERVALCLIGCVLVVLCLAVPSAGSAWARLLTELLAIVLASVVVFLLVRLVDVLRSRDHDMLMEPKPKTFKRMPTGLYVRFDTERDLRWRRMLSGFLILISVVCVFVLLVWRRMGGL